MNLVLIGPQGSGKGTQAELLAKKFKLPVFGAGRFFRREVQQGTNLGKKVAKYVSNGFLVPDQFTEELLNKELKKSKYQQGAIFDGFPRDFTQMKLLEKLTAVDYVIFISISQKETIKRLASRRVCDCGETYNILIKKPRHDLICDQCGHKLKIRTDDTPQAIKARLKIFKYQTLPLLNYFAKKNKVIKVSGEQEVAQVYNDIIKSLRQKGVKKI